MPGGEPSRLSKTASAARRLAEEVLPKWSNASAANTMEYETALRAVMADGHGPVAGLREGCYNSQKACIICRQKGTFLKKLSF